MSSSRLQPLRAFFGLDGGGGETTRRQVPRETHDVWHIDPSGISLIEFSGAIGPNLFIRTSLSW